MDVRLAVGGISAPASPIREKEDIGPVRAGSLEATICCPEMAERAAARNLGLESILSGSEWVIQLQGNSHPCDWLAYTRSTYGQASVVLHMPLFRHIVSPS